MPTTRSQSAAFTGSQDSRPETLSADPVLPGRFDEPQPSQYVAFTPATEDIKHHSPDDSPDFQNDDAYPALPPFLDGSPTPTARRPAPPPAPRVDSLDLGSEVAFSDTLEEADFVPVPAFTRYPDDPSTQYNLRESVNALAHLAKMAAARLPSDPQVQRDSATD